MAGWAEEESGPEQWRSAFISTTTGIDDRLNVDVHNPRTSDQDQARAAASGLPTARRSRRDGAHDIVQALAVPQGFTLSIAGTAAATVGHHGYQGFLAIWLFIVGASTGYGLLALFTRTHTRVAAAGNPLNGVALLNVLPVVVVPAAYGASAWISNVSVEFAAAGLFAVVAYVCLLAILVTAVGRRMLREL
jgi:hypothetical protein